MKKIYLSILMTLCPLLPGMAQQLSQHGRETVCLSGLRTSAAQTPMPFLQEGKEWYYRSVYGPRGADENYYRKISGDTLVGDVCVRGGVILRISQNKGKNIWCFDKNIVSLQIELITI